jgi:alcohol dehydrogenase
MRYHLPTRIVFQSGLLSRAGAVFEQEIGAGRTFLVTDKGVQAAGITDKLIAQLPDVVVFDEIEQNPRHSTVDRAGEIVREIQPEFVLGLGGGSVLDAAKAIALLGTNPGKIEDYEGRKQYGTAPLPVVAIPTTCGTGSEVTWVAVITHSERRFKMSIKGPEMYPALALVDPDVLLTLPPRLVAATGMDALVHAVEAFTVKPATHITDTLAEEALRLIFTSLEPAYQDIQGDQAAREGIMLGSLIAGMSFGNSDVGAVHCLSESIGALFDIPHGIANAVLLPYVMEFNLPAAALKYARIARLVGIEDENPEKASQKLVRVVKDLSRRLNIPSFRELGIQAGEFVGIAEKSFANNSNPSNPREAGVADYLGMLENAYADNV